MVSEKVPADSSASALFDNLCEPFLRSCRTYFCLWRPISGADTECVMDRNIFLKLAVLTVNKMKICKPCVGTAYGQTDRQIDR